MFFRVVEYWINTATIKSNRGKVTGIYSVCFFVGIVVGSSLQPVFGTVGYLPYSFIFTTLLLAGAVLLFVDLNVPDLQQYKSASLPKFSLVFRTAPIAIAGVIAFGLFEDIPAYLLSVYALKSGLTEGIAAYTLTAVAIGNLIFPIPLGILSDRIGRMPVLVFCSLVGSIGALAIPFTLDSAELFLAVLVVWGGCVGCIYSLSISVIGDKFSSHNLMSANAAFGIFYAIAALLGPLLNGVAMQMWEPHGLMVSCGLIFAIFLIFVFAVTRRGEQENAV